MSTTQQPHTMSPPRPSKASVSSSSVLASPPVKGSRRSLLRTDRLSVHSATSSRVRRKQRNCSIDHELHDTDLPPSLNTNNGNNDAARTAEFDLSAGEHGPRRQQHQQSAVDADEIESCSSCSDSLNQSDLEWDSDEDSFCAASVDCAPDKEFLESILIEEHPERLNLLEYAKTKKPTSRSGSDYDSDRDDYSRSSKSSSSSTSTSSFDDDEEDDPRPPSPEPPRRRAPPNRMLTRSTEKLKTLSLFLNDDADGGGNAENVINMIGKNRRNNLSLDTRKDAVPSSPQTADTTASSTFQSNTDSVDPPPEGKQQQLSNHNTTITASTEDSETSDVLLPASSRTDDDDGSDDDENHKNENRPFKKSIRAIGGTFISRSIRNLQRSFRTPSASTAATAAVDTQ